MKRASPTPEERQAIVDAYRRTPRVKDAAKDPSVGYGPVIVARVLREEGLIARRETSPVLRRIDEAAEVIAPLWTKGASYDDINKALALRFGTKKVKTTTIAGIMEGIPRGSTSHVMRRTASDISVSPDPSDRSWLAGVFDARGNAYRVDSGRRVTVRIGTGDSIHLAREIMRVVGGGSVTTTTKGAYYFQLLRLAAVAEFLEAIEPLLRDKGMMARRMIDDLKRPEKGGLDTG